MTSTNGELLNRIDAAMVRLDSGQPSEARRSLEDLRRFVCESVCQQERGYKCDCGIYHAFTAPPESFHGGVHHECTSCGQTNELWRDVSLGEVSPLSGAGKDLINSILGDAA